MSSRWRKAADRVVRLAVVGALLLGAAFGAAAPARAAASASLNIDVTFLGITSVPDLTAISGATTGTIGLTWTEPSHPGGTPPFSYDVRASSVAEITSDADFNAASPLSALSSSVPPAPGAGGGAAGFVVAGLTPGVTYYFAIREKDSTTLRGAWLRSLSPPRNVNNYARATSATPFAPAGGTLAEVDQSSAAATWATSLNTTDYVLIASTQASLSPVAASSTTLASTAAVAGLNPNTTYYLGVAACGFGCSSFLSLGSTITLAAPAISLSTTAVSSSTVSLAWDPNGNPAGTLFDVLRSTDGISFTTAAAGGVPAASLFGLTGGGTYYFEVVAVNFGGIAVAPSNVLRVVTPAGPVPSAPSGLAATAGLLSVALSWSALPPALQGAGLGFYALSRSTNAAFGYVTIATTTGTSFTDKPLAAQTSYYYKILAVDVAGTQSAPTAAVKAVPFTILPMEPLGIAVVPSSSTVTLAWSPTSRFFDGTPFLSTGTPTLDELEGYSVWRSTNICDPFYIQVSTLGVGTTAITDTTGGRNYYYRLFAFNSVGVSTNAVTVSSLGERHYFVDDCASDMVLDDATAAALNGSSNGLGDIRLFRDRRPQDVGNGVMQSVEWRPFLNGATELKGYALAKPARVVLHFNVVSGAVVPDTAPVSGLSPLAGRTAGTVSPQDLGVFWFNGAQWNKMYGKIDPLAQTVTVLSPNTGAYQVRAQARAAGVVFDVSNLSGKVITPNGDGLNDVAIFAYDPGPENVVPTGRVFDLRGAYVADMVPGLVPNTLTWDGKMSGRAATSGVYVYRITGGGKTFSGTIVVAR